MSPIEKEKLNETESPPLKQKSLKELSFEYKSLEGIPSKELERNGFVRDVNEDGSVRVYPVDQLKKRRERFEENLKLKTHKIEKRPFDVIPIQTRSTSIGRKISIRDFDKYYFDDYLDETYWVTDSNLDFLYGQNNPATFLYNILLGDKDVSKKILKKFGIDEKVNAERLYQLIVEDVFFNHGICVLAIESSGIRLLQDEWEESSDLIYQDQEGVISSKKSEDIYDKYERLRGRLSDPDFYTEKFEENLYRIHKDDEFDYEFLLPHPMSTFEISKYIFSCVLERYGDLKYLVEELESAESHKDILRKLPDVVVKTEEEIRLFSEMKTASVKEKIENSKRLKELKEQREEKLKIINGIRQYYNMPETTACVFNGVIKKFQEQFLRKNSEDIDMEFTLDCRPDPILDKDPGKISGDCTEGKPLPFERSDIPIYNIKVFRQGNEHIGNIYLFLTNIKDGESVWHIDAIQVPASIDWDEFISNLFTSILAEAKKKEVYGITVSCREEHISNYDYIQDAVIKYCDKKKAERAEIETGDQIDLYDNDQYSWLQTDGYVFLILAKE